MHCPKCLTEYRDGFYECADCRVPLASGPPPSRDSRDGRFEGPGSDLALVTVLATCDGFAVKLAKASLEEAGIEYLVNDGTYGHDIAFPTAFPIGSYPIVPSCRLIQVAREDEAEARELLEPLKNPQPLDEYDESSEPIG